jgi:hypothetical protein
MDVRASEMPRPNPGRLKRAENGVAVNELKCDSPSLAFAASSEPSEVPPHFGKRNVEM